MYKTPDTEFDPVTQLGLTDNPRENSVEKIMNLYLRLEDEVTKVVMNSIKHNETRGQRQVAYRKIDAITFSRMESVLNELRTEQQKWIPQEKDSI